MIKIISDSSTLYNENDGYDIAHLQITFNNKTYTEYIDISSEEFNNLLKEGIIPKSSQPPVGKVIELFDKYPNDEIINLSMADGLSGTYQSAVMAKDQVENNERITVINTKTICGPHRYLFKYATDLAKNNFNKDQIIGEIERLITTEKSFLIPLDFDFLKRGGRLSPLVANIGKGLHLCPIVMKNESGTSLDIASVKRTFKRAVDYIVKKLEEFNVNSDNILFITHAFNYEQAQLVKDKLTTVFPNTQIIMHLLSPAFMTQGGPGCIAIQTIKKGTLL